MPPGHRKDDELSVDELLRTAGARARRPAGPGRGVAGAPPEGRELGNRPGKHLTHQAPTKQRRSVQAAVALGVTAVACGLAAVIGAAASPSNPPPTEFRFVSLPPATATPGTSSPGSADTVLSAGSSSTTQSPVSSPSRTARPVSESATHTSATPPSTERSRTSAPNSAAGSGSAPTTAPNRPSCSVHFAIEHSWPNGFTASATIANRGPDTLRSWSLAMTFTAGQRLTEGWNGTWTQRGSRLTASAPPWKTDLQPGEAFTTGFNGSFAASNPAPIGFTVNGAACPAG